MDGPFDFNYTDVSGVTQKASASISSLTGAAATSTAAGIIAAVIGVVGLAVLAL